MGRVSRHIHPASSWPPGEERGLSPSWGPEGGRSPLRLGVVCWRPEGLLEEVAFETGSCVDGAESPGSGAAAGRVGQPLRARAFSQPAGALPGPRWDQEAPRGRGTLGCQGAWPRRTGPLRDRHTPGPAGLARSLIWGDWMRPGLPLALLGAPRQPLILLPQGPPGSWAMKQIPGPAPRTTGVGVTGPVRRGRQPAPRSGRARPHTPSPAFPRRTPPGAAHAPLHRWEHGGLGRGDTRTLQGRPR